MHQNRSLSLFSTPIDHFHFHALAALIWWVLLWEAVIPTLDCVSYYHFRIWAQGLTWDTLDTWSEWCLDKRQKDRHRQNITILNCDVRAISKSCFINGPIDGIGQSEIYQPAHPSRANSTHSIICVAPKKYLKKDCNPSPRNALSVCWSVTFVTPSNANAHTWACALYFGSHGLSARSQGSQGGPKGCKLKVETFSTVWSFGTGTK